MIEHIKRLVVLLTLLQSIVMDLNAQILSKVNGEIDNMQLSLNDFADKDTLVLSINFNKIKGELVKIEIDNNLGEVYYESERWNGQIISLKKKTELDILFPKEASEKYPYWFITFGVRQKGLVKDYRYVIKRYAKILNSDYSGGDFEVSSRSNNVVLFRTEGGLIELKIRKEGRTVFESQYSEGSIVEFDLDNYGFGTYSIKYDTHYYSTEFEIDYLK
ncbi:hypothetical protein N6H18_03960 [Reichenbachiella agarivorans]|uniref:Uncharacterized protein n=1 Tax=Reichenbachiella agarivorans TaxID=2979464 RepID=A0ABY6CRG8_9BACT|nr:hypothetical protein [Reichenbachiella agarivorans]UXP33107.1 hypothetical protein N6H18_03960 [Reichenbachiella agarivorans]